MFLASIMRPALITSWVVTKMQSCKQSFACVAAHIGMFPTCLSCDSQEGDGIVPEDSTAKNPNAMKFTGAATEVWRVLMYMTILCSRCM